MNDLNSSNDINIQSEQHISILELPTLIRLLSERANYPLLPDTNGEANLHVRYLRRKPDRGLAVIYRVDESTRHSQQTSHAQKPYRSVSFTLDEQALDGARIRFSLKQAHHTPLEVQPSGVLHAHELWLSLQRFPADDRLPTLAFSCDTTPAGQLFQALEQAARQQLGDDNWRLKAAEAIPVRYKPANRCVIRYDLTIEQGQTAAQRTLSIFGKVYADPTQAQSVYELTRALYNEQAAHGVDNPMLPRPLGIITEPGLTLNEAIMPSAHEETLRTGIAALQAQVQRGRGGEVVQVVLPTEELQRTARALARLHNSAVHPQKDAPRTGTKEAKRVRERAALIASYYPTYAGEVQRLAQELAARLETLQPDSYRPAHGGFKASQLLFHSGAVFVVDFDGFCLADAALDVGYFLAYLRPSGLWYGRPGMRQWFTEAAEQFLQAYQQCMLEHVSVEVVTSIVERTRLYEAALLFKIATRRVNRLNSPRPQELSAMLREIAQCLSADATRRGDGLSSPARVPIVVSTRARTSHRPYEFPPQKDGEPTSAADACRCQEKLL